MPPTPSRKKTSRTPSRVSSTASASNISPLSRRAITKTKETPKTDQKNLNEKRRQTKEKAAVVPQKVDSFDDEPVVIVRKKKQQLSSTPLSELDRAQSSSMNVTASRKRTNERKQNVAAATPVTKVKKEKEDEQTEAKVKLDSTSSHQSQESLSQRSRGGKQSQNTASTQESIASRRRQIKMIKLIQTNVMNAFRGFIESREEQGAQTSLKLLRAAYLKSLDSQRTKEAFSDEFSICLGNLVEGNFDMEARQQATRLMIKFVYSMSQEDKGTRLLHTFIQYCEILMTCEDAIVRMNVVFIIGCLFAENKRQGDGVLTVEQKNVLYGLLVNAHNDKSTFVRAEVVRAVAPLQNDDIDAEFTKALEKSPKEIIMASARDTCLETRVMVLKHKVIDSAEALHTLFHTAESDPILRVRQEAFARLAKVDIQLLSANRRDLTKITLDSLAHPNADTSQACRAFFLNHIIDSIVSFLHKSALANQNNQDGNKDFINGSQSSANLDEEHLVAVSPYIFLQLFVDLQDLNASLPIVHALLGLVDNRIKRGQFMSTREQLAEIISRDTFPVIITKKNYVKLINCKYEEQHRFAFFWRVMLEFFVEKCDEMSAERWTILIRIAPSLEETCQLVRKIRDQLTNLVVQTDDVTDTKNIQGTISNLLLMMRHIDQEETGMKSWKRILEDISTDHLVEQDIFDNLMLDLYQNFYSDNATDLVIYVLSLIDSEFSIENSVKKNKDLKDSVLMYMSKLVLGLLRTGAFRRITDELRELLARVCREAQVARNGLECLGILAIIDLQVLADHASSIHSLINKLNLKKTCLELVASVVYAHGSEAVQAVL